MLGVLIWLSFWAVLMAEARLLLFKELGDRWPGSNMAWTRVDYG